MKIAPFSFVLGGRQGLVDPGNPDQLAAAIDRLLGDAPLARTLGSRAQARATAELHVSRMVERHASLYRDALHRSSP